MTDEELIDGLRQNALWVTTHDAADRIEALVRERDEAVRQAVDYCDCHDFRDGGLELAVTEIIKVLDGKP